MGEEIISGCKLQIKKSTNIRAKPKPTPPPSFWSTTLLISRLWISAIEAVTILHLPLSCKVFFSLCNKATSWPRAFFCLSSSLRSTRIFNCKHSLSFFYWKKNRFRKKKVKSCSAHKQFHKRGDRRERKRSGRHQSCPNSWAHRLQQAIDYQRP